MAQPTHAKDCSPGEWEFIVNQVKTLEENNVRVVLRQTPSWCPPKLWAWMTTRFVRLVLVEKVAKGQGDDENWLKKLVGERLPLSSKPN